MLKFTLTLWEVVQPKGLSNCGSEQEGHDCWLLETDYYHPSKPWLQTQDNFKWRAFLKNTRVVVRIQHACFKHYQPCLDGGNKAMCLNPDILQFT